MTSRVTVSYTHLRAHETSLHLVCRLLLEKKEGVIQVISGYSGGDTKNPTYEEVTYGNTGHFEVIEIIYDKNKINFKDLLDHFWINIDPFDSRGQFCDVGYSYRSVAFYQTLDQKDDIKRSIVKLETVSYTHLTLPTTPYV